jgi:hypothetical protein
VPVEPAEDQQQDLRTQQPGGNPTIRDMRLRSRQVEGEELGQKSDDDQPGETQRRECPHPFLPAGEQQPRRYAEQDCDEQDQGLSRAGAATTIGSASTEDEQDQRQ